MLTKTSRTAAVLALILSAVILCAADTANELKLQQGIDLLESKGDLARATPLFEQASRSSDRAVASRALLYLGGIQERQGREAARATYDRILRDFGNQSAAGEARKRLVAIGVAASDNVAYIRLVEVSDDAGSLSSDGLSMAVIDGDDSGDIAIQDIATGKLRRLLVKPAVAHDLWDAYGEWVALSPDQSKVLFLWEPVEDDVEYQLRIMANKPGSPSRVLFQLNDEIIWIDNGVWFPDSQSALVQTANKNMEWQFVRVGAADKSFHVIKSLQWRLQGVRGRPSISPDGKYIAYSALANNPSRKPGRPAVARPTAPDSTDQYVYVLPADGSGQETIVARSAGINEAPVWTSDGSHILFISDRTVGNRTNGFGLWSVEVRNGKANGAPSPVRPDIGRVSPLGMTQSGSYYYVQGQRGVDIFIRDMQPSGLKAGSTAVRLSDAGTDSNRAPAWSPDGKKVAFKRQRRSDGPTPGPRAFDLVVHTVATGEEQILTSSGMSPERPVWSHDGKYLFTLSGQSIVRFDVEAPLQSRSIEAITHSTLPSPVTSFTLGPKDRTLYVSSLEPRRGPVRSPETRLSITAIDMSTGDRRVIYSGLSAPPRAQIALSPDGRTLALWSRTEAKDPSLTKISVDGGAHTDIGSAFPVWSLLSWSADGQKILIQTDLPSKGNPYAYIVVATGKLEFLDLPFSESVRSLDVSSAGSRIVLEAQTSASELWKIDNLPTIWRTAQ